MMPGGQRPANPFQDAPPVIDIDAIPAGGSREVAWRVCQAFMNYWWEWCREAVSRRPEATVDEIIDEDAQRLWAVWASYAESATHDAPAITAITTYRDTYHRDDPGITIDVVATHPALLAQSFGVGQRNLPGKPPEVSAKRLSSAHQSTLDAFAAYWWDACQRRAAEQPDRNPDDVILDRELRLDAVWMDFQHIRPIARDMRKAARGAPLRGGNWSASIIELYDHPELLGDLFYALEQPGGVEKGRLWATVPGHITISRLQLSAKGYRMSFHPEPDESKLRRYEIRLRYLRHEKFLGVRRIRVNVEFDVVVRVLTRKDDWQIREVLVPESCQLNESRLKAAAELRLTFDVDPPKPAPTGSPLSLKLRWKSQGSAGDRDTRSGALTLQPQPSGTWAIEADEPSSKYFHLA